MNERNLVLEAMDKLKIGSNTNIAERLTLPLHYTNKLVTAANSKLGFFDKTRSDNNSDYAITNCSQANRVPSKQAWIINAIAISVCTPAPLTEQGVCDLMAFVYDSAFIVKLDDSTKLETTLSTMLGASTLVQTAGTVGTSNLNSLYSGVFKLHEPLYMAAETQFEISTENKTTTTIPATLNGVKIRVELKRDFIRLV